MKSGRKYRFKLEAAILILWLSLAAGCQLMPFSRPTTPQMTGPVTVVVRPAPVTTPTPYACSPLPVGASWTVQPAGPTEARVEVHGMVPGDHLTFRFIAPPVPGEGYNTTYIPNDVVDPAGDFSYTEYGLDPRPGTITNTWTVEMFHSAGVACTSVQMPPP